MITGHLGIAAAVQAGRRDSSLFWLLGASMAPDVVDALFFVARTCNPNGLYSHTLPAAALVAVVTGAIAYAVTKQRATGALCALLVLAHLPPDFVTGHKLFWPGGEIMGLRLYDHPIADFALESMLVTMGWWLLRRRGGAPRWATTRGALALLLVAQIAVEAAGAISGGVKPSACGMAATATTSSEYFVPSTGTGRRAPRRRRGDLDRGRTRPYFVLSTGTEYRVRHARCGTRRMDAPAGMRFDAEPRNQNLSPRSSRSLLPTGRIRPHMV